MIDDDDSRCEEVNKIVETVQKSFVRQLFLKLRRVEMEQIQKGYFYKTAIR